MKKALSAACAVTMMKCLNKHFIVITAIMVIGLFGLSATANSQETVAGIPDFAVTCTNPGQLCDPPFSVSLETGSVLQARYFVRSTHCSSVRVHLFVDGTLKATTGFLGWPGAPSPFAELPLDTGLVDLGPVSPGTHLISFQAEGQVGGCNSGQPESWGGSLEVPHATTVQPVQLPGQPPVQPPVQPGQHGQAPVLCNGLPATIVGDSNSNMIFGTPGNDVIDGLAGNDTIFGLGGDDVICGGPGRDKLDGNSGKDKLFGGAGNDVLKGGTGRDRLYGNGGNDKLFGGAGNDVLKGGTGRDRLYGNGGNDAMNGQSGSDRGDGGRGTDKATRCERMTRVP
ncbi:MAG: calcium-binding protein [Gammaproteobacteria bacterium]